MVNQVVLFGYSPVARDAWFLISIGLIVLAIVIALRSILLSA